MKKFTLITICLIILSAGILFSANVKAADLSITSDFEISEEITCKNLPVSL